MLSRRILAWLENEVVGQSRAVNTLGRAATLALSGLGRSTGPIGSYLLIGPSGTGKTHMARALARLLREDRPGPVVADCTQLAGAQDLRSLSAQIAPWFNCRPGSEDGILCMQPHSVLLVEHLEAAKPEFVQALLGALEAGHVLLPDGSRGSLVDSIVLLTSNLCSREIYGDDRQEIGFSGTAPDLEEREKARIYEVCAAAAEKRWGSGIVGHLDDVIVFHRLRDQHAPRILARLLAELNDRLAPSRISIEVDASAADFLLSRGRRYPQHGAWFLTKVFRRFVVFPLADIASMTPPGQGARVRVGLEEGDRLRFESTPLATAEPVAGDPVKIAVDWDRPVHA